MRKALSNFLHLRGKEWTFKNIPSAHTLVGSLLCNNHLTDAIWVKMLKSTHNSTKCFNRFFCYNMWVKQTCITHGLILTNTHIKCNNAQKRLASNSCRKYPQWPKKVPTVISKWPKWTSFTPRHMIWHWLFIMP